MTATALNRFLVIAGKGIDEPVYPQLPGTCWQGLCTVLSTHHTEGLHGGPMGHVVVRLTKGLQQAPPCGFGFKARLRYPDNGAPLINDLRIVQVVQATVVPQLQVSYEVSLEAKRERLVSHMWSWCIGKEFMLEVYA